MMQPVSGTPEQFKQSFRDEAREILTDLESSLLALNENPGDANLVSRIFRGLHTIKGSGSMFGFERMAAFTHDLETAYDRVRNGVLIASPELINLTLSAVDQITAMLEEEVGGVPCDQSACAGILDKVRRLAGLQESRAESGARAAYNEHNERNERNEHRPEDPAVSGKSVQNWLIRFAPGPDLLRCGANPLLLLRELGSLGGLSIRASMEAIPPLAELDPERCYVAWDMVLATSADRDTIRDVFIFVEDACELSIEPDNAGKAGDAAADRTERTQAERIASGLAEKRTPSTGRRTYDKPDSSTSLRIPAIKLDHFVNLVGELVTVQARLSELAGRSGDAEVTAVSEEIERLASALRESSMDIRMMPIRGTFEKFRRLVHDLARELNKDVELSIEGAETELDKTVIEQLGDPLMHLIRNSMDHGIEPAADRLAQGKPATASIRLSARHSGASVLISVRDDGGGIDAEAVRRRAIEKHLVAADAQLSEAEIFALIFQAGFSTAKQVTDVSGRGVGMDVVRQRVDSLRGSIEVTSKPGLGTTVMMRLPLTMAIIDGLVVDVGDSCFVLPMGSTLECIELTRDDVARANGKHLVNVRGEIVPYVRLREHFNVRSQPPEIEQIMLVETAEGRFGIVVDHVLGNCQTVIKSLGRFYHQVQIVSGATILGNGAVALILDPERLIQEAVGNEGRRLNGREAAMTGGRTRDGTCLPPHRAT